MLEESKYFLESELENWLREKESNLHLRVQSPTCCQLHHPANDGHGDGEKKQRLLRVSPSPGPHFCCLEAMKGLEPLSSGLQDRHSVIQFELHRRTVGGAKRSRTSTSCLQGRHHPFRS